MDSDKYASVLLSCQTISNSKQMQTPLEANVVISLLEKPEDVKTTFHYDITNPCNINGERPPMIINFTITTEFASRSLFFVYEDQGQIIFLLFETFNCLSVAASF